MAFNLFDSEETIIEEAEALKSRLDDAPREVHEGIAALIKAYRRSVRQARQLVKVSDRLQNQLASANRQLERRQADAEEALAKLRETQENLVQAEKLASLGGLVAGIAHEVNTPIGILCSCASHLADATAGIRKLYEADDVGTEDFEHYLETAGELARLILANSDRAASLIRSFKQVAVDRTSSERRRFELRTTIEETLVSLAPRLRQAGHSLALDCPPGIVIDGYPGALSQILTNLMMNAILHAFAPGRKGHLSIAAGLDADAPSVSLRFSDDGKGIPQADKAKIFDPFFTTSRGHGGTGLGLHIVYNLVTAAMGGTIGVDTAPGGGTCFTLVFPTIAPGDVYQGV